MPSKLFYAPPELASRVYVCCMRAITRPNLIHKINGRKEKEFVIACRLFQS